MSFQLRLLFYCLVALTTTCSVAKGAETLTPTQLDFFEKKIRPVLSEHCYKCHSAKAEKTKGGLALDTREGLLRGGENGPAIVPGNPDESLLIEAVRYGNADLAMPPKKEGGKLPDAVISDFEAWVRMGAPDPREGGGSVADADKAAASWKKKEIDINEGRKFWAFQRPKPQTPPQVNNAAWPKSDIDKFVLAKIEEKGLQPVADANKFDLLRRVTFDLTGLPPSIDQVQVFLKDASPNAFEKVVDDLLASERFGERWGRHWLDVARYAESSGKEVNVAYPHAWRYRDYVIAAFNADKPYDRFLKEQLAGDLLPIKNDSEWANNLVATGFLAIGPKSHNTRDVRQFQFDVADEQIDAVTQGMLGLTVACARCHDHKFDPVPQRDYYAMAGIFLSTETHFGTPRLLQNSQTGPLIWLPDSPDVPKPPSLTQSQRESMKRQIEGLQKERAGGQRGAAANPRFLIAGVQIATLQKQLDRYDETGQLKQLAMGVQDKSVPHDAALLQRGEIEKPKETVPRGFVQVISANDSPKIAKGSGRLELANWIASHDNPLTARVMVNRVWVNLFDHGIVPTPDNFGATGLPPTNQELLDFLALSFIDNGWSVKKLIRQIVLSRTYQLASDFNEANYAVDPDNVLQWRMNKRRLDAESIRDAMLVVAGRLDLTPPSDRSPVEKIEGQVNQPRPPSGGPGGSFGRPRAMRGGDGGNPLDADRTCRSVYLPIVRDHVPESLAVFDFAESSLVVGHRDKTTVPSQALYLMNNASIQKLAEAMAARLVQSKATDVELGKKAIELAYSRQPTANELKATSEFFIRFNASEAQKYSDKDKLGFAALTAFCQALLGSAEFLYLN